MSEFRAVHQFHSGAAPGDAITEQMKSLQQRLHALGFASEIFAAYIDSQVADVVTDIRDYPGSSDELLLFHHSMGSAIFDDVAALANPFVTVYHNVTPESFFVDAGWKDFARLGRQQLRLLAVRSRHGVADSNFNRQEMLAVGFQRADVLPVRTDFGSFAVDPSTPRSEDWLFVGRVVANKAQLDVVRAFALYARAYSPDARLVLVGDLAQTDYVAQVRGEVDRLGIGSQVVLTGKVSDAVLRRIYARSGVYVSLSRHEGFGVPILEAMAAGLPVIALAAAAIPETMGGAGLLVRDADPAVVAAAAYALREDSSLRERLVARQYERIERLERFDSDAMLSKVIAVAAGSPRPLDIQVQGPFETSYSLAVLNRRLAESLSRQDGVSLTLYATEGPGDYIPNDDDLVRHPEAAQMYRRAESAPYPDVAIRQMYPPRVADSPGGVTLQYFGWEESRLPPEIVEEFNRHLTAVGAMSSFVRRLLRDSGVTVPIVVTGVGVDVPAAEADVDAPELAGLASYRFLHVSSAFPRKGVDLLLSAYFANFTGADDVSLLLKTFPNPHNEVAGLLDQLRRQHSNPPRVHWIDRDLPPEQLASLFRLANCYVHPARGEGFGLPVAEAMAAGLPVITVAYSGLADLASESTAVLVPYRLERANTHLSVEGSMWAEPDAAALGSEMRRMAAGSDVDEWQRRVKAAAARVGEVFTWDAVAARWREAIELARIAAGQPHVAVISTWNSACGIAENTRYIVEGLGRHARVDVFADYREHVIDAAAEEGVTRCWISAFEPDLGHLEHELVGSRAEIIHLQFNFGFFGLSEMAAFTRAQRRRRAVVVSLHRTREIDVLGRPASLSSVARELAQLDQVIVHQEADRRYLERLGVTSNVSVVPLGAPPPPDISPEGARQELGLGSRPLLGTFGFLLPHKGLLDLLDVFATLRRELPDVHLIAACALHPDPASSLYEREVRAAVQARGLEDCVTLVTDFLPDESAQLLLRAVDGIVLPYRRTEESSSAALRFLLPLGRPVVTTDLAIFDDARDAILPVAEGDRDGLLSALRRVLLDEAFASDLAGRASAAARRFRWDVVAAEHRQIYASVLARRRLGLPPASGLGLLPDP